MESNNMAYLVLLKNNGKKVVGAIRLSSRTTRAKARKVLSKKGFGTFKILSQGDLLRLVVAKRPKKA